MDDEHVTRNKDTTRLRRWLQEERIQSKYFDPTRFHRKMLRLKNFPIKQVSFILMPTSQRMIQIFCSCIAPCKELADTGYNENTKKKEKIVYEECCVCHDPMDSNVLSL